MTRGVRWSREQEARRATNATQRSKCAPPPLFRTSHSAFRILLFAQRKQVRKQAVRARNPGRELAEERERGVDVHPLPYMAHQQAALERWIAGIVHLKRRGVGGVPVVREVQPPLRHPPPPIGRADLVRYVKH